MSDLKRLDGELIASGEDLKGRRAPRRDHRRTGILMDYQSVYDLRAARGGVPPVETTDEPGF